jgi:penicillin amidase
MAQRVRPKRRGAPRGASLGRKLAAVALAAALAACGPLAPLPEPRTLEQRLAMFPRDGLPLSGPVTIHWDAHQIPFIEAAQDSDAAFALGLVHAHLRLGQMEIFRRIALGRIAEMGGPLATDIDHGLRILDYDRAAAEIEAGLPPETRAWLEAFVAGLNHYQRTARELPFEYTALGLPREPWRIRDLLAFGRLAGTDVNWLVWFNLIQLRDRDDWPRIWARLVANGRDSTPSFDNDRQARLLHDLLAGFSRSGSNSLVVSPARSRSGGALIANDPHLGINLPNLWLLAGIKSPSYHAVGLMVPGLPFFAIGRNPWIAWGGTNMRAAASDLYDLSDLPATAIRERRERIAVRWWFDREVTLRDTRWGPILSDAPLLKDSGLPPVALRWTGHMPSDETTAMLSVSRARGFDEFRAAFESFAVPGQNMLYADDRGNIGQVMAVRLPERGDGPPSDLLRDPAVADREWRELLTTRDLPFSLNPPEGFLASANNRPTETTVPVGYFFSPNDRVKRMAALLDEAGRVGSGELKRLQRDVYMASAVALRDLIVEKLAESGLEQAATGRRAEAVALLRAWDGRYEPDSRGALAFELFRSSFSRRFYESLFGAEDWSAFAGVARIQSLLLEDIRAAAPEELTAALRDGLETAAAGLERFADWGEMHRLVLSHPLGLLPVIGGRFRFADQPIGGSSDTLMKTAHGATDTRHATRYGSNARHISDLTDPDENLFVLLGGQDGWINSTTFLDQLPLWLEGRYIRVPLRLESVSAAFPHRMTLSP